MFNEKIYSNILHQTMPENRKRRNVFFLYNKYNLYVKTREAEHDKSYQPNVDMKTKPKPEMYTKPS